MCIASRLRKIFEMTGNIYVVKNNINGKCYVGQTIRTVHKRLISHKSLQDCMIGRAIHKYGEENFTIYELREVPRKLLDPFEIQLIKQIGSLCPNGYNLALGGSGNNGGLSAEHKAKIGAKNKGKKLSEETKEKLRQTALGRPSPMKGRNHTKETRQKQSEARMGMEPWNKGIPRREETKRKASAALMGRLAVNKRKVICVETGHVFDSIRVAALWGNTGEGNLCACCHGRLGSSGGYHWKFLEEIA